MEKPDPSTLPQCGFYYHYKHDPNGPINNYAYEAVGLARDTETEEFAVMYRPLYDTDWIGDALFYVRPLTSFTQMVTVHGTEVPRFSYIEDDLTIALLTDEKIERYG